MTTPTKKFTTRANISFDIDDDTFWMYGSIPADLIGELSEYIEKVDTSTDGMEKYGAVKEILKEVLMPESAERFLYRMSRECRDQPIDASTLGAVLQYLVGELGQRPTQSSEPSEVTSESTGESSTDGAPTEELILEVSPGIGI